MSLTIDPVRDDIRHLRAYQRQFPALRNWTVLTGSPRVVGRVWHTLGVWRHMTRLKPPLPRDWVTGAPLTTDIAHTDELIFISADQRFRYEMDGYGNVPPSTIPHRIYRFMDALGHRNVASPDPGSWTPAQVNEVLRLGARERGMRARPCSSRCSRRCAPRAPGPLTTPGRPRSASGCRCSRSPSAPRRRT